MNIKKYLLPLLLITITTASALIISSCDIKSPVEGLEVILNTVERETLVSVSFYDANTGVAVSQNVSVTFTGPNAVNIADQSNKAKTTFTAENGFLVFAVKDGTVFSSSSPFRVTANLSTPGFTPATQVIELLAKGKQSVDINMVNPATLPANADQGSTTGTTSSTGTTTAPIVINSGGGTNVTIPTGTTITTSSGTPLVGNVSVNVTSVPITAANANNAPQTIAISNSSSVAPAVSINLSVTDQSGNSANTNVETTIPIAEGIANPRTGAAYKAGDTMESYSLNPTSGLYEKVGEGTITATSPAPNNSLGKTNAGLTVTITVRAGTNTILGAAETTCTVDFTVTGAPAGFNYSALKFVKADGTEIPANGNGQGTYTTKIPSTGTTAVTATFNGTNVGSANLSCSGVNIALSLPSNFVDRSFVIQGECTKGGAVTKAFISTAFRYKKTTATKWNSSATDGSGNVTIGGLEVGATYNVSASYTGPTKTLSGTANVTVTTGGVTVSNISDPAGLKAASPGLTTTFTFDIQDQCN